MAKVVAVAPGRRWDSLLLWGFLGSLALIRSGHLEERDPYWQIRAGLESLAGAPLVRPDTWTWSGVQGNWYPNSPLWNILLGLSYQLAGVWGFFLLSATTMVILFVLVTLLARRLGSRPLPGLLGLLVAFAAAYSMLNARATLLVQVLLLFAIYVALRLSDHAPLVSPLAFNTVVFTTALGLSTLGNSVHLSFLLLAPALTAVWALIWFLTPGLTTARRLALSLGGGTGWMLGTLLSPYGLALGLARSRAVQEACQGIITEWSSPFAQGLPTQIAVISSLMLAGVLLLATATVVLIRRRWRAGRPVRDLAALALVGVPTALAGALAIRFLGVGLLIFAPVAAALATSGVDRLRARLVDWPPSARLRARLQEYSSGRFWRIVLTGTLVVLSPGVVFLAAQHGEPAERTLAARLPAQCHLFSSPGIGGAIELLRPDVPVWMDGRADFFGRDVLVFSSAYYGGSAPEVAPSGTTCVLLDSTDGLTSGLEGRLQASPAWHLDATDGKFKLWLPAG